MDDKDLRTEIFTLIRPKAWMALAVAGLVLGWTGAFAAPPNPQPKPPCGTNGPLGITTISPTASYTYTRTVSGSAARTFTISSPSVQITGNCDSTLPPVFGNGKSGADIDVMVSLSTVTPVPPAALTADQEVALREAFGFDPSSFILTNPGSGNQQIAMTFTNTDQVPAGTYDVVIAADSETGVGVGSTSTTFTVTVEEPTVIDTLAPEVTINAPAQGSNLCLNGNLSVNFTAVDPTEGGAGTGITAVRASNESAGGAVNSDISGYLSVSPDLPVEAGVDVTASATLTADQIGSFVLHAEVDDNAGHTGYASQNYSVTMNVTALPPISVAGRQFKTGSTVPIKWTFTDCEGNLLPPLPSVSVKITDPGNIYVERYAGDGAGNIRWELDAYGRVTHYITNYDIPLNGTYTVDVYVQDVDANPAKQGSLSFIAASKGGKM